MPYSTKIISVFICAFIFSSCATTSKTSERALSVVEARKWLQANCSKSPAEKVIQGEMLLRGNTQEFKGQFPASIKVEKDGKFILEVTNILGGTMAQISGDLQSIEVKSTTRPKLNRKGVEFYMGIPAKTLVQLIRGELPCPDESDWKKVLAEGSSIAIDTGTQKWAFSRLLTEKGEQPGKIRIEPQKIDLSIEDWDPQQNYAKKVMVKTEAGNLKWIWKSREQK